MARPRKDLTAEQVEQVEKLAAVLTQAQIADYLGISDRTLRTRMSEDPEIAAAYARGRARAVSGVATSLLKQATSGNVPAAIFFLKSQAGWKETTVQEHTGKDGGPIEVQAGELRTRLANRIAGIAGRMQPLTNGHANGNGNGRHA